MLPGDMAGHLVLYNKSGQPFMSPTHNGPVPQDMLGTGTYPQDWKGVQMRFSAEDLAQCQARL